MPGTFNIFRDEEFVIVEGLRLHYVSQGAGAPVVLLHGNAGFTHDYLGVMNRLAERRYRALAFDRPGHGQSERSGSEIATAEAQARLIRQALLKLEAERPIMVGHSWGGLLVLAYALQYGAEISAACKPSMATTLMRWSASRPARVSGHRHRLRARLSTASSGASGWSPVIRWLMTR
jgi:pimeloyl-ACP methyl ester carboxylesterase